MNTYKVVNPLIIGSVKTEFNSSSALESANLFYKELSDKKCFHGPALVFKFTLSGGNKLHDFTVKEIPSSNSKNVSYDITESESQLSSSDQHAFIKYVNDSKSALTKSHNKTSGHSGGKHKSLLDDSSDELSLSYLKSSKHNDSSSSDSDDFFYKRKWFSPYTSSIQYISYNPTLYWGLNGDLITVPSFVTPTVLTTNWYGYPYKFGPINIFPKFI